MTKGEGFVNALPDWRTQAACGGADLEELFGEAAQQHRAKAVCEGCAVKLECLVEALDHRIEFGVWGGMTDRERRALLRRRPTVTSWRRLLEAARSEHRREPGPGLPHAGDRLPDVPLTGTGGGTGAF
ncbi:WhiB family transcriptional regulator [Streptomyces sp. NBC_00212]|uniref:WhiB family transcriptional regulator n=1 Tax=Streptomyces sp. NBC_00212 TaxID=2975684 RepID=UPI00386E6791